MAVPSWNEEREHGPVVRPYAVTGGRTRSVRGDELELETLVSTTAEGELVAASLGPVHRSVLALCRSLQSVAEVAARLDLPLRVARVLVGDLLGDDLVVVYRPDHDIHELPDLALMARVLDGLRAL